MHRYMENIIPHHMTRNLLRDVVGRYVGNEPDSLFALEEIQKTAALMRFELERGNVDGLSCIVLRRKKYIIRFWQNEFMS